MNWTTKVKIVFFTIIMKAWITIGFYIYAMLYVWNVYGYSTLVMGFPSYLLLTLPEVLIIIAGIYGISQIKKQEEEK